MNVLLTGKRQVGKTTVCKRVADLAQGLGYNPAGVLTPVLLDNHGFPAIRYAQMVPDGQKRLLAWANGDQEKKNPNSEFRIPKFSKGGPRTSRYSFDAEAFSWAIGRLRGAISLGCDLLIIDEIGPLELEQGKGLAPILSNLSAGRHPPLLLVVRLELAGRLQERLPGIAFRTFTVTQENRQALADAIVKELFADYDPGR